MRAELGKTTYHEVILRNPSDRQTEVRYVINNSMSFDVKPKKIMIPPLNEKRVKIYYIPSLLNEDENGEVVFTSEDIG